MPVIDRDMLNHRHEVEVHNLSFDGGQDTRDPYGYYYCRMRCGLVFKTKATRNRYLYMYDCFDFLPTYQFYCEKTVNQEHQPAMKQDYFFFCFSQYKS